MAGTSTIFQIERIDDATVVRLMTDAVDNLNLDEVLNDLKQLVQEQRPRKLLLNLSDVQYFHSIALGRLVRLNSLILRQGGQLRLCCLQPTVMQVLVTTQLDRVLETRASEQAALAGWTVDEASTEAETEAHPS